MQVNNDAIEFCTDILAARLAEEIAKQKDVSLTKAVQLLMATKTYSLLIDKESYLYLESFEYIMDMLAAEESKDWSRWLEV